jgi:hypothetical protein
VTENLVINMLLAELILGYSRESNSRPLLTDHGCMLPRIISRYGLGSFETRA